jgi:hypothetical protein
MNVTMMEHCTFDCEIFGCGKVYYSSSIITTNCVSIFIPNCQFEKSSLLNVMKQNVKKKINMHKKWSVLSEMNLYADPVSL